ncbi:hypothetical protein Tco_1327867 [Tanacetum coccineum]
MGISLPNIITHSFGNMNVGFRVDDNMNENVNDEDVEMEVDDEAELIFPYESSDSVSSDSESEDEEADIAPGPTVGTATQRPFAIRDFTEGMYGNVESPTLHVTHHVKKKERKILDYDLGNVEKTLGNVVERLKILESGENATLKRKLDETETRLAWARMERDTAERSLHESTGWNRRFYWEMVLKGAVPKPPSDDEDDGRPRKKSKKSDRDDGPSEPRGPPSDS